MVSVKMNPTVCAQKIYFDFKEASLQPSDALAVNRVFKASKGFTGSFKSQLM